jgi:putative flippase GtrA
MNAKAGTTRTPIVRRWLIFNVVGAAGIAVQLAVLALLTRARMDYLLATALAVEASVLHNFFWHERWTWEDRRHSGGQVVAALARFHLANGAVSIIGNLLLMRLLVGAFGVYYLVANVSAIAACSVVNFFAGDRFVFVRPPAPRAAALLSIGILTAVPGTALNGAELRPETLRAWGAYVAATENRIDRELASRQAFLALDFQSSSLARPERIALLRGEIPVRELTATDGDGRLIRVPAGMVHHWRGAVFIPGVGLEDLLARVADPGAEKERQEDVLASRVLERGPDSVRLYLKLQRSKIVTVVYNTEHLVRYARLGPGRAASRSVATRIAELENPNSSAEREKPPGTDRGFLWKLNSYWRYEQVEGGVIVECESLSLSRSIPALLEYFVRPLIDHVVRESMQRTLSSMRQRMKRPPMGGRQSATFWRSPLAGFVVTDCRRLPFACGRPPGPWWVRSAGMRPGIQSLRSGAEWQ